MNGSTFVTRDSLIDALAAALQRKCVEPVPRKCGGSFTPVYASHRFPIKGGISAIEVMARNICRNNTLLARLRAGRLA